MTWHVQFRRDSIEQISRFPTPELAIAAACGLIDQGLDVWGIGHDPVSDTDSAATVARIYAIWRRAHLPYGATPN